MKRGVIFDVKKLIRAFKEYINSPLPFASLKPNTF